MVKAEFKDNLIYFKSHYNDKDRLKSCGAKWDVKLKQWYLALDLKLWDGLLREFGDELQVSPILRLKLVQKEKDEKEFIQAKELAESDAPIDFSVDGITLNGTNPFFNYQKHGVVCGLAAGDGFLIGDTMGLGKTLQGIGIALEQKNLGNISECLIVCPASLKYNWVQEIKKFTNENYLVIEGKKEERRDKWLAKGYFFKIVNYEIIVSDLFYARPRNKRKETIDNRIDCYEYILNNQDMIIVDEIQYLKSHSSQRSRALKAFKAKYRIGLTGTPMDGKLEELHSIFDFLKPGLLSNKTHFMNRHAILNEYNRVIRYLHVDEVKEKIRPYYVRRLKEEVLKDLPPKIFKDIYVELPIRERRVYNDLIKGKNEITEELMAATKVLRARQFLNFPEVLDLRNPSAKYAMLHELLEELIKDNNEKVIIFTQFRETLELLVKNLSNEYNIVTIHGGVKTDERIEICNRFNNNKSVNIIIMTNAGATGLNLASAQSVINYEDDFSPATNLQRFDRAHRANTKHTVTIYRFITVDTIEERVREILDEKMMVSNMFLDEANTDLSGDILTNMDLLKLL